MDNISSLIDGNAEAIWRALEPHLKVRFKNEKTKIAMFESIYSSASFTVGTIWENGPKKNDKVWRDLDIAITRAIEALDTIPYNDLPYLDSELRRNKWDFFEPYSLHNMHFFQLQKGKYLELNQVREHSLKSLMVFQTLLDASLKNDEPHRPQTTDDVLLFCEKLFKIYSHFTGKALRRGGHFEKFAKECCKPFYSRCKVTDSTVTASIRKLIDLGKTGKNSTQL